MVGRCKSIRRLVVAFCYLSLLGGVNLAHGYWNTPEAGQAIRLAQAEGGAVGVVPSEPVALPASVPLHCRDELGLIVRHIDAGDIATAREHWRKLLRAEARAGRAELTQRYLDWIMAHAYRDELDAARKAVAMNRFYESIEQDLRQHQQEMRRLQAALKPGEVRVVRTVTHVPAYREPDTPPAHPVYAPRQMNRAELGRYLVQLQREIDQLGHGDGLQSIDLAAAEAKQAALAKRIQHIAGQLHEDALVAASSGH